MKDRCLVALAGIAQITNRTLNDFMIELYSEAMDRVGDYPKVLSALKNFGMENKMPSPKELEEACGVGEVSLESNIREVPELIWKAIERKGAPNPEAAKELMGDLAWQTVQLMGGWESVCASVTNVNDKPAFMAQWRGVAKAVVERAKFGKLGETPALPSGLESAAQIIGTIPQLQIAGKVSA